MKQDHEMLERLVAVGLVVLGCLFKQYIIAAVGIIYFIAKM